MGNIAKNINKSVSVLFGLSLMAMPAKAETAKTNIHNEAKTAKIELASDMIKGNTHEKALKVVDSQNPAKNEGLDTEPPKISNGDAERFVAEGKPVVAILDGLTGVELTQKMADNNYTTTYITELREKLDQAEDLYAFYRDLAKQELYSINAGGTGSVKSATKSKHHYQALTDEASDLYDSINKTFYALKKEALRLAQPTAEDFIGIKNMDPVFAGILENPKFAGTIINNKELNALVFAEFSPEFQKRFNELGLILEVEKHGKIFFGYFVCGKKENGETYKVKFFKNYGSKSREIFVLDDPKYGKVLCEYSSGGYTQQIREISPTELEKITIQKNGEISFSQKVIKNLVLGNKEANN